MGLTDNIKTINLIPFRRQEAGITLIELVVTIVITSIVGLGIVAQFVTEQNFRTMIRDRIEISREARLAAAHMAHVLRFAMPGTITTGTYHITATIEGGHLSTIAGDTPVTYRRNDPADPSYDPIYDTNTLLYTQGATKVEIAEYITTFDKTWNNPYIKIKLTARKGNLSITIQSKVRVLPD